MSATRADISTVRHFELLMQMPTMTAGLAGRKPFVNLDEDFTFTLCLICEHVCKHAPTII